MDGEKKNLMEICEDMAKLSKSTVKVVDRSLKQQTLRMDTLYDRLLQQARRQQQKDSTDFVSKKKTSNKKPKSIKEQEGDVFVAEPSFQSFQQPSPPICRTRRQAAIAEAEKEKNVSESPILSSGAPTRASRARAVSTSTNVSSIGCPKANSTLLINKQCMENVEKCLAPQLFSTEKINESYTIKCKNSDKTYSSAPAPKKNVTKKSTKNINLLPEEPSSNEVKSNTETNKSSTKTTTKIKGEDSRLKEQKREKLGDINVNVAAQFSQLMTRAMNKKLQGEKQRIVQETNVIHVFLENPESKPLKPADEILQSPRQIREQEAKKKKELHLKSKADQRKFDDEYLKTVKRKEENMTRIVQKIQKIAEKKVEKEEKQQEKDLIMKMTALKKQTQAELRLAEINKKRKFAEEAIMLNMQKAELERRLKENGIKKKNKFKSERSISIGPIEVSSTVSSSSTPRVVKFLPKTKVANNSSEKNDYGLNNGSELSSKQSQADSSSSINYSVDDFVPKKTVQRSLSTDKYTPPNTMK